MQEHDSKAVAQSEAAILSAMIGNPHHVDLDSEDYSSAVLFFARRAALALQDAQTAAELGHGETLSAKFALVVRYATAMADMPCCDPSAIAAKLHLSQLEIARDNGWVVTMGGAVVTALQASALRDQMQIMGVAA
ncbi:hypothetical protein FB480_101840 [Agrobacterium vitis]|nr:hypothetical protein FB480_101840 [Agrobacterium vitis]